MSTTTRPDLDGMDAVIDALNPGDDTDADDRDDDATDVEDEQDPDGADELGDKGKQALARMKARLREERQKRRDAEARLEQRDDGDAVENARREAERAALAKANTRIVKAEIRAAATGRLADPADALTFIDPKDFEVDDDGNVDAEEIAEAVADLIARKPYLAAQGGPRKPKPDLSQGETGTGTATTAQQFASALNGLI